MTDSQSTSAHCFESDPAFVQWLDAALNEQPSDAALAAATRLDGDSEYELPLSRARARARHELGPERPFDLARLWSELCAGRWRFIETFTSRDRHFAIIEDSRSGRPTRRRNQAILERIFSGISRKEVAIDLDLAQSTVSVTIQMCLSAMGLTCRASSAPVILAMAVRAATAGSPVAIPARVSEFEASGRRISVISTERPERQFPVDLSRGEVAVARLLAVGHSHAEIATLRKASVRTVANQLAGVFRKLGVSGRAELVDRLISHSIGAPAAPTAARPRAGLLGVSSKISVVGRRSRDRRRRDGKDLPNRAAASVLRSSPLSATSPSRSPKVRKATAAAPTVWAAPARAR